MRAEQDGCKLLSLELVTRVAGHLAHALVHVYRAMGEVGHHQPGVEILRNAPEPSFRVPQRAHGGAPPDVADDAEDASLVEQRGGHLRLDERPVRPLEQAHRDRRPVASHRRGLWRMDTQVLAVDEIGDRSTDERRARDSEESGERDIRLDDDEGLFEHVHAVCGMREERLVVGRHRMSGTRDRGLSRVSVPDRRPNTKRGRPALTPSGRHWMLRHPHTFRPHMRLTLSSLLALLVLAPATHAQAVIDGVAPHVGRDPAQAIDSAYTRKIHEYTTETFFLSPLVDYLPASATVPTPVAVLGDIAGARNNLPYSKEVYAYFRLLEKSSPRVRVVSIGTTEEGREMIAVAVASESLIAGMDANRAKLAKLADPRSIGMNDAEAARIVADAVPVYYITGTIHSPESGAPTALMELAYRLAVDESPYVKSIRDNVITLITPIVEVDGRDRVVDLFKWHMAHPGETFPNLLYWGHYVAHDNNRDAMALTLKLSRNVLDEYVREKAQVLHDLHESVPYLYDNTIGDGPYNAWIDPLLTNEWQMMGWHNVQEMTRLGMPGVFTHGQFDTWSPGYLMFMAATHNGISRLYETFGNGGTAETLERTLSPSETQRTWWRQNPPLPRVQWSLRNNNNYEQTGLLVSLAYFAEHRQLFLQNFYEKSKRSVLKPRTEGPAAYVLPSNDPRPGAQADLLNILMRQHVELSRATAPFSATSPRRESTPARSTQDSATRRPSAAPA